MILQQKLLELVNLLPTKPNRPGAEQLFDLERLLYSCNDEEHTAAANQLTNMILSGVDSTTRNTTEQLYLRLRRYSPDGSRLATPVGLTRPAQQREISARAPLSQ